jgi:hypothetical protein
MTFPFEIRIGDHPFSGIRLDGIDQRYQFSVIPAQARIQYSTADSIVYWIPACAGMTKRESPDVFN